MSVRECGGEPSAQKWDIHYMDGRIHNAHANVCLNVEGCESKIIYDGCPAAGKGCDATPTMPFPNEVFSLKSDGQLVSALPGGKCATVGADKTVSLMPCGATNDKQKWKYGLCSIQYLSWVCA